MKTKVLHVSCGGLGYGGVSTVIFSIVEPLVNKVDFDCVVFNKRCDREELFEQYGKLYRVRAYNSDGRRNLIELIFRPFRLYFGILSLCKKNKYNVIHAHNNTDEGICLLAAKHAGVPIRIAHSHNTNSPRKRNYLVRIQETLNRFLINCASTDRIGCSDAACSNFFGDVDYRVIYNSLDLNKYQLNIAKKGNPDEIRFIHVGRYTYQKNQEHVIKVFKHINDKFPNSILDLVGFGEDYNKLRDLVKELKLESNVRFIPGDKVDFSRLYDYADYMIFPSRYEGFGIVLIEAQSKGIECFVSNAIQKEADLGLLTFIPLELSEVEWAKIIINYINTEHKIDYDKLKERLNLYSSEVIADEYAEVYGVRHE